MGPNSKKTEQTKSKVALQKEGAISDALTHVDIFCQQLVRNLVLLQGIVVDAATC